MNFIDTEKICTNFAESIKELMAIHNLNLTKFSELCEISRPTVSKWFHEINLPRLDYITIVSDKFNLSTDYLLQLTADPKIYFSNPPSTFKQRLNLLIKSKQLNMSIVANKLNIEKSTFSKWQRNAMPKIDKVILLAQFFGVTVDYMIGR